MAAVAGEEGDGAAAAVEGRGAAEACTAVSPERVVGRTRRERFRFQWYLMCLSVLLQGVRERERETG